MASVFEAVKESWDYLFTELSDERSKGWWLVDSPVPLFIIIMVYYQFVKNVGPNFMKNRKPYNINRLIQAYNISQIILCGWLAYESFTTTFGPNGVYSWKCQPMDKSVSPFAIKIARFTWMYYMIKVYDLLDTVFFVLRKKYNQISFLHVFHHIGILILGIIGTKYFPDGQGFLIVPVNSFVHCFMYSYYLLTNYNPEYRKQIWWKKYITQMQMIQFVILFFHVGKVLLTPGCEYPTLPVLLFLPPNGYMIYLFWNFYKKTYLNSEKKL